MSYALGKIMNRSKQGSVFNSLCLPARCALQALSSVASLLVLARPLGSRPPFATPLNLDLSRIIRTHIDTLLLRTLPLWYLRYFVFFQTSYRLAMRNSFRIHTPSLAHAAAYYARTHTMERGPRPAAALQACTSFIVGQHA
eukprot:6214619-Pleurochrysis_carterae.AAC.3